MSLSKLNKNSGIIKSGKDNYGGINIRPIPFNVSIQDFINTKKTQITIPPNSDIEKVKKKEEQKKLLTLDDLTVNNSIKSFGEISCDSLKNTNWVLKNNKMCFTKDFEFSSTKKIIFNGQLEFPNQVKVFDNNNLDSDNINYTINYEDNKRIFIILNKDDNINRTINFFLPNISENILGIELTFKLLCSNNNSNISVYINSNNNQKINLEDDIIEVTNKIKIISCKINNFFYWIVL